MKLISLNIPENYLKLLEILVAERKFPNRSEAIRMAIRDLIKMEFRIDEAVNKVKSEIINSMENDVKEEFPEEMVI